jgi:hypothetical protein
MTNYTASMNAKNNVEIYLTLLYAGSEFCPAGTIINEEKVYELFPSFQGNWLELEKQIAYRDPSDKFYTVEKLTHAEFYRDITTDGYWLREVATDDVIIFPN